MALVDESASAPAVIFLQLSGSAAKGYRLEWRTGSANRFQAIEFATREEAESAAYGIAGADPRDPAATCRLALKYLGAGSPAIAKVLLEALLVQMESYGKGVSVGHMIHWVGVSSL